MTVGERIKNRRIDLGMTQEELAKKMGYSGKSSVCKAETWGDEVTTSKVHKFAIALGVTDAYLMGWETEKDWTNRQFEEYMRMSLMEVYMNFGYDAYLNMFIYENMNDDERNQVLNFAKFTAEQKGIKIPSEEEIRNMALESMKIDE